MGIPKCTYLKYRPLPQENVLELAKGYKNIVKIEYLCRDTIKIVTLLDTFFCEVTDKFLVLKHQVNPRKQHTHLQHIFYDFEFLFESLERHDEHKYTKRGTCRIEHLYTLIKGK
jgi:hypothetical protein